MLIVFGEEMGKGTEGCGLFRCHFHYAESFLFLEPKHRK